MSIKTKIAALAVATVVVAGGIAATTQQAEAHPKGLGLGLGIATGLVVGSAIAASSQPVYAYPVRRCFWQPQYNVFGQYVGSYRTCNF
jgi:hypothetical protein